MKLQELIREIIRLNTMCAHIVASVHGVIPLALANKREAAIAEAVRRGLDEEQLRGLIDYAA